MSCFNSPILRGSDQSNGVVNSQPQKITHFNRNVHITLIILSIITVLALNTVAMGATRLIGVDSLKFLDPYAILMTCIGGGIAFFNLIVMGVLVNIKYRQSTSSSNAQRFNIPPPPLPHKKQNNAVTQGSSTNPFFAPLSSKSNSSTVPGLETLNNPFVPSNNPFLTPQVTIAAHPQSAPGINPSVSQTVISDPFSAPPQFIYPPLSSLPRTASQSSTPICPIEKPGTKRSSQPAKSHQILVKTMTGESVSFYVQKGLTLKQAVTAFIQEHKIDNCSFIFNGKVILKSDAVDQEGHKDSYDWTEALHLHKGSVVHLIVQGRQQFQKISAKEKVPVFVKTLNGRSFQIEMPPDATMNDFCNTIATKAGVNPASSIVRIISCGQLNSTPDLLVQNIFKIAQEYEWNKIACIHAIIVSLSSTESSDLCQLLEKHRFPKFSKGATAEKTLELTRMLLWSTCDRLLRRRPGVADSCELEQQLKVLKEIENEANLSQSIKGFVSGLIDFLEAAYQIYAATAVATYDELIKLMESQLVPNGFSEYPPCVLGENMIKLNIKNRVCTVPKARLVAMSSYFATLIDGVQGAEAKFQENLLSDEEIEEIELEEHSVHLLDYLEGKQPDLAKLTGQELIDLINTANAFMFHDLSFLCQQEHIRRLQNVKTIEPEMKALFKTTPFLAQAYRIRLAQNLWQSPDFKTKIQNIQKQLVKPPAIPVPTLKQDEDIEIDLVMPSGTKKIMKSQLMKCSYFNALLSGSWKESADKEFHLEEDLPQEIFNYLTNNSEVYKTCKWDRVKELLPFVEFFGLPELVYYFKSKVCDALLKAHEKNLEKQFCDICMYLQKEIAQWAT